jgi:spermidine/putrescine transport system permease protein
MVWMGIPFPLKYPIPAILMLKSLVMSLAATVAVILLAYPMAYFLAFHVTRYRIMWIILLTIPFWTSYLLRVFAWRIVLGFNGAINTALQYLGIIDAPLEFLLYNPVAVTITLAHAWVAFAVLPIYVSLEKIDRSLLEAAADLGDSAWQRFRRVTLPLSAPGTIGAALLVFIPTVGDYVTPTLVGGPGGTMIGSLIQELFLRRDNAPLGAAVSIVMMIIIGVIVAIFLWLVGYRRMRARHLT